MYHNSFIIADTKEAFVLETADKWWIVENVRSIRSISNGLTIRGKGDYRKKGIIQHAISKAYCKDDNDFDFALTFSGSPISIKPSPYSREGKSAILLNENKGIITPSLMMEFLREHQAGICMHGGFESTGSQISHLRNEAKSIHWFTGTNLPCISIYKPYIFPIEGQKYYNPGPYQMIDPDWFWCKHTKFKPINKKINLNNAEKVILSGVKDLIIKENEISEDKFNKKIRNLNLEAWNKSYELLM
jgi:dipeptidase